MYSNRPMESKVEARVGEGVLTINCEPKRAFGIGNWSSKAIGTLSCTTCMPGQPPRTIERQWPPKGSELPRRLTAGEANSFAGQAVRDAASRACEHVR